MSLRLRMALVSAVAVAVAIAVASSAMYVATREQLVQQTDSVLHSRAMSVRMVGGRAPEIFRAPPPSMRLPNPEAPGSRPETFYQVIDGSGRILRAAASEGPLPVSARAVAAAGADAAPLYEDVSFEGLRWRVYTMPVGGGFALQVARPVDEIDAVLQQLGVTISLVLLGGVLVAAALGAAVAQTALRPIDRLTRVIEELTRTRDLTKRVPAGGGDEIGRLAESFNSMLKALERSLRSQRQLVADASHELRTPITSLRTNLELLARGEPGDPLERQAVLRDVVSQIERLSRLVAELIDLAREEETIAPLVLDEVALDDLVRSAIATAAQQWPRVEFELAAQPSTVRGDPARIERAVRNLLDNAAKWSPPNGRIEVRVRDGEVSVRDHGPGVSDQDAPHVFDRFWRAPAARSMPGSGLGLAIVKEVARVHEGSVSVEPASGGGALFRLRLPESGPLASTA